MLETQQKEVHDALVGMEGEALRLYKVHSVIFMGLPDEPCSLAALPGPQLFQSAHLDPEIPRYTI